MTPTKTYYPDGKLECEGFLLGDVQVGNWTFYYENGQIEEEGEYLNGEYSVINFWTEAGEQILKDKTGKTIRKFGATGGDVYEQYFENGKMIGEKKIASVTYGEFIPKANEKSDL